MKLRRKGTFGYIKRQTIIELCKTVFMIALCAGTYYLGLYIAGSNQNLLTFVAILGCLPMAKFFVNTVLFFKAKGCSEKLYNDLGASNIVPTFYDLYFTAYKDSYQVSAIYYKKGCLIGITEDDNTDLEKCEKHLSEILSNCGAKNVTVKIFKEESKFIERINSLSELEEEKDISYILENILAVSI